jgi:hypothetical protein
LSGNPARTAQSLQNAPPCSANGSGANKTAVKVQSGRQNARHNPKGRRLEAHRIVSKVGGTMKIFQAEKTRLSVDFFYKPMINNSRRLKSRLGRHPSTQRVRELKSAPSIE